MGATRRTIRAQVLLESVILCASAGTIGVAGGFVPALRAEKLQVIEALRSE